jgi:hypothetical protein
VSFELLVEDVLAGRRRRAGGSPVFHATSPPVPAAVLSQAETRLGARLPAGYKWLLERAGAGSWCDEEVPHPADLYRFDADSGAETEGLIAVVWNADGTGDYLAFKPAESASAADPPLYLCSHDPYGCNRAAETFGHWAVGILVASDSGGYFYESAYDLMDARIAAERAQKVAGKKWWMFWK